MRGRRSLIRAVMLILIIAGIAAEHLLAQPQPPSPSESLTVLTPDPTVIPPHAIVLFTRAAPAYSPGQVTPRGGFIYPIRVANSSDQPVTGTHTGNQLTIEAPDGKLLQLLGRALRPEPTPVPISPDGSAPLFFQSGGCLPNKGSVVVCDASFPSSSTIDYTVEFTIVPDDTPTETVALSAGCTDIILTWPVYTPLRIVAAAIDPPEALESIWRFVPSRAAIRGLSFSPISPAAVNDITRVNSPMERAFICLRAPATLTRPLP